MSGFAVAVCGAGVAGLEALLRLRRLGGDGIELTLLAEREEFVYRPLAVLEPFADGTARRYPVGRVVADTGTRWIREDLAWVARDERTVHGRGGAVQPYDALLLAVGAGQRPTAAGMQVFSDRDGSAQYRAVVAGIADGTVTRLAFVLPDGPTWPLPLFELAMLTARTVPAGRAVEIDFVMPAPPEELVFGAAAGQALAAELADAGVRVRIDTRVRVDGPHELRLADSGLHLRPDHIITLPTAAGPNVRGIGGDGVDRFLTVDDRCRVRGCDGRVFAAGDATDHPVKHGGISAQQADTAAAGILALAGLGPPPPPLRPVVRAGILTGRHPLYLQAHVIAGRGWQSEVFTTPPWPQDEKIVAAELGPYLHSLDATVRPGPAQH